MNPTHKLIAAAYTAFNARDIDAVLVLMQPDVDWPNGMEGGRVHGHQAVRDYWTRQWKLVDPNVIPVSMTDDAQDRTTVDVHQVVKDLSGKLLLDQIVQHIYTVQNDLIARMDIHEPAHRPAQ